MKKYHHLGIPTDIPRDNETYLKEYKAYVSGYETSPYGVEVKFSIHLPNSL